MISVMFRKLVEKMAYVVFNWVANDNLSEKELFIWFNVRHTGYPETTNATYNNKCS